MKGFALRLVLKQRHKRTRKWPIDSQVHIYCNLEGIFQLLIIKLLDVPRYGEARPALLQYELCSRFIWWPPTRLLILVPEPQRSLTCLDGEPRPRAGEKNGARKSEAHLSSLRQFSVPKQVSLLTGYDDPQRETQCSTKRRRTQRPVELHDEPSLG